MLRGASGGRGTEAVVRTTLASQILDVQRDCSRLRPSRLAALLRMGLPPNYISRVEQAALRKHSKHLLRPIVEAYSKAKMPADAIRVLRDQQPTAVKHS